MFWSWMQMSLQTTHENELPPNHPNPQYTCLEFRYIVRIPFLMLDVQCSYIRVFSITGAPLTTPDPPVDSLSPATTAFIIVISLVVVIIVVFLAIKTILLRRKMESFRRKDDEPLNSIILADGSRGSHPRSSRNEYSHIPTGISRSDGKATGALQINTGWINSCFFTASPTSYKVGNWKQYNVFYNIF